MDFVGYFLALKGNGFPGAGISPFLSKVIFMTFLDG